LEQIEVAGSFRRRKETVGDLDILVACTDARRVIDHFLHFDEVTAVLAQGETKSTVRLRHGLQVDLRAVPKESYGAALQYFTGSKQHNIEIRRLGQERGLKINEYGIFRGKRRIGGKTEAEVYKAVGLHWIPPELREGRNEIELARAGSLPKLVELKDIRGDLHMHTTATDGHSSIEEMIQAAARRGYKYIAITDHSKRVTMAKGLDSQRLRQHWKAIDQFANTIKGITVLKGVELDILEDGTLDLPDSVLAEADWVVASIHYRQNQSEKQITRRLLNAIRNPHVDAIGHPTGRLINKRKRSPEGRCRLWLPDGTELPTQPPGSGRDRTGRRQRTTHSHRAGNRCPLHRRAAIHGVRCLSGPPGRTTGGRDCQHAATRAVSPALERVIRNITWRTRFRRNACPGTAAVRYPPPRHGQGLFAPAGPA
jgi:DNA polymerase (family 10)